MNASHAPWHDLESFYWVLTWIVLQYLKHDCPPPEEGTPVSDLFDQVNHVQSSGAKIDWLCQLSIKVEDNAPLSWLLDKFKGLALKSAIRLDSDWAPLTHTAVLRIFDEALAMPGWPVEGSSERREEPSDVSPSDVNVALPSPRSPAALPIPSLPSPQCVASPSPVPSAFPSPSASLKRSRDDAELDNDVSAVETALYTMKRQRTSTPDRTTTRRAARQCGGLVRRLWAAGSRIYGLFV